MKKVQPSQTSESARKPEQGSRNFLLSLIIPCYNESKRIDLMLAGLAEFSEKWKGDYEVIIVDDGSKDDTVERINKDLDGPFSFLKDKIHLEKMPANGGKGAALKQGVSVANGDYIVTLDADMSTKPTELINWERKEKDLFTGQNTIYIASRKHEDGKVEALPSRRLIGGVFNTIVQIFTTLRLKDTQCGFKLYPKAAAKMLFGNMQCKGWAHDVEVLYQADLNDINIKEMPVYWVNQPESKVNVLKDSMVMLFQVLSISMRIWFYNSFLLPFRIPETTTPELRKLIIYRSVFNVLALLLLIVMPAMSFQYSITGDEHWHFDYGNSIYNYFFSHGDTSAQTGIATGSPEGTAPSGIQFYGGIFDFIAAVFFHLFHIWDHYTTMHFLNAIVGAIGIIYAGKLARLLGGWNTAILTMILLVLSPSWFGHNFANPKDIPFSVGYTAGLYFILLFLQALPNPNAKHIIGLVCSIGWAMGVRIGGFLLIAYLVLFIGCYAMYTRQLKAVMKMRFVKDVIIVSVAGYLIAILFWPYSHENIIGKPMEALKIMSNFFINIGLIYDGKKILSNQVPWYYIPRYVLYTAPIVVLVGAAIGFPAIAAGVRKNRNFFIFSLFVLFSIAFPVTYAIYKKSSLYDGWRHFLFIYPPLVVLASIGWMSLINAKQKALKYVAIVLIIAGLISPVRFAIANHPFESLYYNEIAGGLKNMYGRYETDYYMLGMKPATEWLIKNEHLDTHKAVVATNCIYPVLGYMYQSHEKQLPNKYATVYEHFADFRRDSLYMGYEQTHPDFKDNFPSVAIYVRYNELYQKDWDYCILFSRFVDISQLTSGNWPPAETIYTVKVDGVPIAAVLKRKTKKDLAGFQLMKAKKIDEAKDMFLQAIQEYPQNDQVWEALAQIYEAEGKPDSAIFAGRNALKTYPGNINVYQMIGSTYLKQHMADSALKLYKGLAQYNESYSHFFQAYAYATIGNANGAFSEIDAAIDSDPYNEQAYKLGMQLAQQTRNQAKSDEYYDRAKKAFPEEEGK